MNIEKRLAAMIYDRVGIKFVPGAPFNAGFAIFNNETAEKNDFYSRFGRVYGVLAQECPALNLMTPVAESVTAYGISGGVLDMDPRYNHKVRFTARVEEGSVDVIDLH